MDRANLNTDGCTKLIFPSRFQFFFFNLAHLAHCICLAALLTSVALTYIRLRQLIMVGLSRRIAAQGGDTVLSVRKTRFDIGT